MVHAIERLQGADRGFGFLHYRRDYGNVVYSETEVSLWLWKLLISRTIKAWQTPEEVENGLEDTSRDPAESVPNPDV